MTVHRVVSFVSSFARRSRNESSTSGSLSAVGGLASSFLFKIVKLGSWQSSDAKKITENQYTIDALAQSELSDYLCDKDLAGSQTFPILS